MSANIDLINNSTVDMGNSICFMNSMGLNSFIKLLTTMASDMLNDIHKITGIPKDILMEDYQTRAEGPSILEQIMMERGIETHPYTTESESIAVRVMREKENDIMTDKEKIEVYLEKIKSKGNFIDNYSVTFKTMDGTYYIWVKYLDGSGEIFDVKSYEDFLSQWEEW